MRAPSSKTGPFAPGKDGRQAPREAGGVIASPGGPVNADEPSYRGVLKDAVGIETTARERAAQTAQAQSISKVGTWQFDTAMGEVVWSEEMFRICGFKSKSFKPSLEAYLSCVHPEDRVATIADIENVIKTGRPMDAEYRIVRPSGEVRHVHSRAVVITRNDNSSPMLLGTLQDETEQHQMGKAAVAQATRLKEMQVELIYLAGQSALSTMAATVAHELNQPLTAIINYATGVGRLLKTGSSESNGVEQIAKNARRANEIIRRLRDMTLRGYTAHENFDLNIIVREAAELVTTAPGYGVVIDYQLGASIAVLADRIQIQQVVMNLVRNACEAAANIPDAKIWIETFCDANSLTVVVSDNGPGVDEEVLSTLFERRISIKPGGTGIGLSISRAIIEIHGGSIKAENRLEGGARFRFTIPRVELS